MTKYRYLYLLLVYITFSGEYTFTNWKHDNVSYNLQLKSLIDILRHCPRPSSSRILFALRSVMTWRMCMESEEFDLRHGR